MNHHTAVFTCTDGLKAAGLNLDQVYRDPGSVSSRHTVMGAGGGASTTRGFLVVRHKVNVSCSICISMKTDANE